VETQGTQQPGQKRTVRHASADAFDGADDRTESGSYLRDDADQR
jgi:hypothetical protein